MGRNRDSKGRFTSIENAEGSTPEPPAYKDKKKIGDAVTVDRLEDVYRRPTDGLTEDEAATKLEDVLADMPETNLEGYVPEDYEGDPDALRDALNRLRSEGTVEAATKALEEMALDSDGESGEGDGDAESEPVPWETLAEAAGLDADRVTVRIKIQGEDVEVPLSEALDGYMKTADYTRKTQELAERRKDLEGALDTTAERLTLINEVFRQAMTPEQQALLGQAWQRVQAERQSLLAHYLQEEVLPAEHAKLRERLGWESDEEVQAGKDLIATAAVEHYGFTPEDLQAVTDHRLMVMAHDAAKYREMLQRQEEAKDAIRGKRRKSTTLKPGTKGQKRSRGPSDARKRLARSGSIEDAAAALDAILPDDVV